MAIIKTIRDKTPAMGSGCYLAENAVITGDVVMGERCSVWFGVVIRGDVNTIRMGDKVNIQDGAVVHCSYMKAATVIGNNVSVGHRAIVHGCTIGDNVLIGMGAIVMDHAVIGSNSIIAAGAVVTEKTVVEPGSLYAGVPARKIKDLDARHTEELIARIADNYVMYSGWYSENS
jgi:carbonic anhydrase/acetyltransferase-like protein (isoleucine patch superfamily)